MERTIKFQAWNSEEKKMYQVDAIDWSDGVIISCHLWDGKQARKQYPSKDFGDQIIFRQYTGKRDIFNKEIYEHDIVRAIASDNMGRERKILIINYIDTYDYSFVGVEEQGNKYGLPLGWWESLEIIGNIFENPELLK